MVSSIFFINYIHYSVCTRYSLGASLSEPHLVSCMAGGGVGMYVCNRTFNRQIFAVCLRSACYKFARYENGCRSGVVRIFPSERFQWALYRAKRKPHYHLAHRHWYPLWNWEDKRLLWLPGLFAAVSDKSVKRGWSTAIGRKLLLRAS